MSGIKLLKLESVTRSFGTLRAIDEVSFAMESGTICGLIGPNGAGKTTLINMVSGITPVTAGKILLNDRDITALPPWQRARFGLARTYQGLRLFPEMSLTETVLCGMHLQLKESIIDVFFRRHHTRSEEKAAVDKAHRLLSRVGIVGDEKRQAGTLSYGDQRRLEIACALASNPHLLMLDEPAAGLNPTETVALAKMLRDLSRDGLSILLIEHDMSLVMSLCHHLIVLNFGRIIASGDPAEIRCNHNVIQAYLGQEDSDGFA